MFDSKKNTRKTKKILKKMIFFIFCFNMKESQT